MKNGSSLLTTNNLVKNSQGSRNLKSVLWGLWTIHVVGEIYQSFLSGYHQFFTEPSLSKGTISKPHSHSRGQLLKGDIPPPTDGPVHRACCNQESSSTISVTGQEHCPLSLPLLRVPVFHNLLLCVPSTLDTAPGPPPPLEGAVPGSGASIPALIGPQRISGPPAPVGTVRRARTDACSYPCSPRRAPSRRPGRGIHARQGGRGPAGPASGMDGTRRLRGCALGLGEPGTARSARASPGRTRGAFAARALGSGWRPLGLCSRWAAAGAANRRGRRAGTKGPAPVRAARRRAPAPGDSRPAGAVPVARAPAACAAGSVSRSLSGAGGALRRLRAPASGGIPG